MAPKAKAKTGSKAKAGAKAKASGKAGAKAKAGATDTAVVAVPEGDAEAPTEPDAASIAAASSVLTPHTSYRHPAPPHSREVAQ